MAQSAYTYGPQNGRIGNVVARRWMRRTVTGIYQPRVHNPRTAAQVAVRSRFRVATQMFHSMSAFLNVTMRDFALSAGELGLPITSTNYAISRNMKNGAITVLDMTTPETVTVDYPSMELSRGNGVNPTGMGATSGAPSSNSVVVTWTDNTSSDQSIASNDVVMVVAYNPNRQESVYNDGAFTRRDQTGTLAVPATWVGDTIEVFIVTRTADAVKFSPTAYVGSVGVQ